MKILVSACLLGENCKYNGGNNYSPAVVEFVRGQEVMPLCPEMMAGLGCPRTPIEIADGVVVDRNGNCVDNCTSAKKQSDDQWSAPTKNKKPCRSRAFVYKINCSSENFP